MQLGNLNKVWEIRALKRKPKHDEAKQILERISKQVQPIMLKHRWRVKVLSEFCPRNDRLLGLNVNAGVEVKLRLRRPNRDLEFYPFDQVLDTMLHELCHNAHGPHNSSFYQLWDQLRKECEELMAKGVTGTAEGFDLPGRRLGGFSRQPPLSSLRKTALSAAENRLKRSALLPSGPLHLGGDKTIMSALTPVQAAAMAAERRLQDEIWCASAFGGIDAEEENNSDFSKTTFLGEPSSTDASTSKVNNTHGSSTVSRKRSHESDEFGRSHGVNSANIIDLTRDKNLTSCDVCDPRLCKKVCGFNTTTSSSMSNTTNNCGAPVTWTCEVCTLVNPALALVCNACETLKPKDATVKYKLWSCGFCTLENSISMDKCSACDQWRYSRGPPLSTRPPNLGT